MARILIVDDDELMCYTLRKLLENNGHETLEAGDGLEGIRILRNMPCDLMVVDIFMPKKDGFETLRVAIQENPSMKTLAISGLGGYDDNTYLDRAIDYGADGALVKPFEFQRFMLYINKLLGPDPDQNNA